MQGAVTPVLIVMAPGGRSGQFPTAHAGEQCGLVFVGELLDDSTSCIYLFQSGRILPPWGYRRLDDHTVGCDASQA
jgi:hypothetical protein